MHHLDWRTTGFLVVDAQQGFTDLCPDELPVPGGTEIVAPLNELLAMSWARIDASQDWHPSDHCSFLGQRDDIYPPHCVAGTRGADFLPGLRTDRFEVIWRKGFERDRDAYALTAQHPHYVAVLREGGIAAMVIAGLATNICCFFVAKDLREAGFRVLLVEDASAGIDVPTANLYQERTREEGRTLGIDYVTVSEVRSMLEGEAGA